MKKKEKGNFPVILWAFFIAIPSFWIYSCTGKTSGNNGKVPSQDSLVVPDSTVHQIENPISKQADTMHFSKDYLMGKFDPENHSDFTIIQSEHCSSPGMTMRKDAYEAFTEMYNHAQRDGIHLKIISATRPFEHQKRIWEGKWSGKRLVGGKDLSKTIADPAARALKILEYSSMPGTSRHHWGTDIDLNNLENAYFNQGPGLKVYNWLVEHAPGYGFCQPYSAKGKERPHGYEEEKWHWSFKPVSRKLTAAYKAQITNDHITGFEGSQTAVSIDMIGKYVLGISQDCY